MAITLDVSSNSGAKAGPVTTYNWNHTVSSGSNLILVVSVGCRGSTDANRPITGITYHSVALSPIRADVLDANDCTSEMWYLLNPDVGTFSIAVTHTGSLDVGAVAMASSFFGVAQQAPEAQGGQTQTPAGPSASSCPVTTLTDNALIVDSIYNEASTIAKDASQSLGTNLNGQFANSDSVGQSYKLLASHGATTMVWTFAGDVYAASAAAFAPATGIPDKAGSGIIGP